MDLFFIDDMIIIYNNQRRFMEKENKLTYTDFSKEIIKLCENHGLESHSGLFITSSRMTFEAIKREVIDIYEKYEHLTRRVHFINTPDSAVCYIKLTYTFKPKRVSSAKRLEEGYYDLIKFNNAFTDLIELEDFISGKVKLYENAIEKRIYYSFNDGVNSFSDQLNVGVATVIFAESGEKHFTKGDSKQKKINRLIMLSSVLDIERGVYYKLESDTKSVYDMITI